MAGPWEKYQTAQPASAKGPWEKYQAPVPAMASNGSEESPLIHAPFETGDNLNPENIYRGAAGAAYGAASVVNPLSIPHGIETLVRAPFESADPNKGFFGRIQERLSKASNDSIIPEMSPDKIAASLRTGLDLTKKAIETGSLPTAQDLSNKFSEEMVNQKNAIGEAFPKGSVETGVGAAGAYSLGSLVKDIASGANIGGMAASLAEQKAAEAIRPIKSMAQRLEQEGRFDQVGRRLIDENIMGPGTGYKTMLARTEDKLDEYGQVIGHYAKQADNAVARDSSIPGIPVKEVLSDIQTKIVPQLVEDGKTDIADQIINWTAKNLSNAASNTGDIGYQQSTRILKTLRDTKAKFSAANDTPSSEAFQDVYHLLNEKRVDGIEAAMKAAGSTEQIQPFLDAKTAYRDLSDIQKILEKTVAAKNANRSISLTDSIVGTGAGAAAMVRHGGPQGVVLGAAGSLANKLARERGTQVYSSALDQISKLAEPSQIGPETAGIGAFNYFINQLSKDLTNSSGEK